MMLQPLVASDRFPCSSLRFWAYAATEPGFLDRQLRLIGEHPGAIDDIWLGTWTGMPSLAEQEQLAIRSADAAKRIREQGIRVSLQITESLGHWGFGGESYTGVDSDWRPMVGNDGATNTNVPCPQETGFLDYLGRSAAIYAGHIRPDTIWIDDDLRMNNHGKIRYGCFCAVCLDGFSARNGKQWTRKALAEALVTGAGNVRSDWQKFNQQRLAGVAGAVAAAVHAVSPETRIALQNSNLCYTYNGADFDTVYRAMRTNSDQKAGVRIGGGAYTDFNPQDLLHKAYSAGASAQAALRSGEVDFAVAEVENYPHSLLGKSAYATALEGALNLAYGCNGLTFVLGTYQSKSDRDEGEYFRRLAQFRPLYDRLRALQSDARPWGINPGRAPGFADRMSEGYGWTDMGAADAFDALQSALPVVWNPDLFATPVSIVTEQLAEGFDQAAFDAICKSGALVSGNAFLMLQKKGLTEGLGIRAERINPELRYREVALPGKLNGDDAGTYFYVPSGMGNSVMFRVESDACKIDYLGKTVMRDTPGQDTGYTTLIATTPAGGQLALSGVPGDFTRELTGFKQRQLLRMIDAVWDGGMPVMPSAGQAAVVIPWCKADGSLRAVAVLNPTITPLESFSLELRRIPEDAKLRITKPGAADLQLTGTDTVTLPTLNAWELTLVEVE